MNDQQRKDAEKAIYELNQLLNLKDQRIEEHFKYSFGRYRFTATNLKKTLEILIKFEFEDNIVSSILFYAGGFLEPGNSLKNLLNNTAPRPYGEISSEMEEAISVLNIFSGDTRSNRVAYPFIASYIVSFDQDYESKVETLIHKLELKNKEVDSLLETFRKELSQISIEKYASIFGNQAARHSRFFDKFENENYFSKLKIGAAELWLAVGFAALFSLPSFLVYNFDSNIFLYNDSSFSVKYISWYSVRLVILSAWVFLLRVCFKNYNSNKLLATINVHRENVLNSFKLLSDLIPSDNVDARVELIKEITKNTYFAGKIPYGNDKGESVKIDSLLELFKSNKL
ncbi:hypothetical protein [Leptospira haakeii]|uniref:Uncharacterized protein n=1 Tax=Leptospira haakeii TaxID=2023198 RepID=A0ABX4PKW6_9LEPT|nr:hypothetical protein [Leptospira haakeii]PKA16415.1 hypothetical protein CH363_09880 [Leptospira haakeii]PKA18098.1 hypothetical protein CH377_19395 [Leptospira haakeii]